MRWFKHISLSSNDEVMSELIDEFGAEGYGVWWLILEKISQGMFPNCSDKTMCSARFSLKNWSTSCRISSKKFQKLIVFLEKNKCFSVKTDGKYLSIECAKLLKYRDEYSKKKEISGDKSPDKIKTDSGQKPMQEYRVQSSDADTDNKKLKQKKVIDTELKKKSAEIWEYWKLVMNSPASKFDDKRKALIEKRLSEHGFDELKIAIDGCRKDDWWMSNNRNGIKYIFKDADSIESFSKNNTKNNISKDEKIFNANKLAGEKAYAARMERKQQQELGNERQRLY